MLGAKMILLYKNSEKDWLILLNRQGGLMPLEVATGRRAIQKERLSKVGLHI